MRRGRGRRGLRQGASEGDEGGRESSLVVMDGLRQEQVVVVTMWALEGRVACRGVGVRLGGGRVRVQEVVLGRAQRGELGGVCGDVEIWVNEAVNRYEVMNTL